MHRTKLNGLVILGLLLVASVAGLVRATDTQHPLNEGAQMRASNGTTYVDISAAVYTSAVACLTIEPQAGGALQDVKVWIDLDKASTGFQGAGYTSQTIQFRVARKVDGTNWKRDNCTKYPASALAADDADNEAVEINLGTVSPNEDVRVEVVLSAEVADIALPYVVTWRGGAATITPQTN